MPVGPCIAYCWCSRVASVHVVVPAPAILCFAHLSIVRAQGQHFSAWSVFSWGCGIHGYVGRPPDPNACLKGCTSTESHRRPRLMVRKAGSTVHAPKSHPLGSEKSSSSMVQAGGTCNPCNCTSSSQVQVVLLGGSALCCASLSAPAEGTGRDVSTQQQAGCLHTECRSGRLGY